MAKRIDYFASDAIRQNLKQKTIRGGAAIAVSRIGSAAIQFVSIPVLSRLLTPDDFGIVAMAMVFTGFAQLFVDAGLSVATIQRQDVTQQQASNLFWFASLVGVTLAALVLAMAVPIGWVYGRPEVAAVVAALAATFVMSGLTVQHNALMQRAMRFDVVSSIQLATTLAGQSAAIYFAWSWRSYWALVVGQMVQAITLLTAVWVASGWRPGAPMRGAGTRSMIEFGAGLSAARLVTYTAQNADKLLIGSVLGANVLGLYERALKVLMYPIQTINAPLTSLMLPALSRLVNQPEKYQQAYYSAQRAVMAVSLPIVAFVAIDADRLIPFVLGEQWSSSVPIFRGLTVAAFLGTFNSVFGWANLSHGRGISHLKWQVCSAVAALVGYAIGVSWGAVGVAIGFSISRACILPLGIWIAYRDTPLTVSRLWSAIWPLILSVSIASGAAIFLRQSLDALRGDGLASMAGLAAVLFGLYAALAYAFGVRSLTLSVAPSAAGQSRVPPPPDHAETRG